MDKKLGVELNRCSQSFCDSSHGARMALSLCVQLAVVALAAFAVAEEPVRYDGYHLLSTVPQDDAQVKLLAALQNDPEVDFWKEPRAAGHPVDIFVSQEKVPSVEKYLADMGLVAEVVFSDAQKLIGENDMARFSKADSGLDWKNYYTIDAINAWLKEMAQKYNQIATVITAGRSTEGRDVMGLRIAHKPNLPILFIEAGIHAREWITPATATWFIQQALNTTSELIKSYEWHVFPSVNPDGYAYTQTNRMWRKTRSKGSTTCIGVDANRNWPYKWQRSNSACAETYPGPSAASEPETKGLINYLKTVADRTRVYISLHSYSQLLMYPWGYTEALPTNNKRFHEIAGKAVKKLSSRFGTNYIYGPIATTIYPAAGNTVDYAYSLNITYPFVFELRDQGRYGFLLPKEQIIPTALETFDALNVILEEAKN